MRTFVLFLISFSCVSQERVIHAFPENRENEAVAYLPSDRVSVMRDIVYCDSLKVDVYRPKGTQNGIALVLIHGGGWTSGDKEQMAPLANRMAEWGYVCFLPQYRLSGQARYPAAIQDILAVMEWVTRNAKTYGVDSRKVVVGGFSAGGHLAALAGTTYHKSIYQNGLCVSRTRARPAAIMDIDGILAFIHPESGEGNDGKKLSAATQWFGYPKSFSTLGWEEASPLNHVSEKTPPILFLNSSIKRMHAGREDFNAVLQKHHIYFEVHEFEKAPHDFCLRTPWFEDTLMIMDEFMRRL